MEESKAEYLSSRLGSADRLLAPVGPVDVVEKGGLTFITGENYPYPIDYIKQLAKSTKREPRPLIGKDGRLDPYELERLGSKSIIMIPNPPMPWTEESSPKRIRN